MRRKPRLEFDLNKLQKLRWAFLKATYQNRLDNPIGSKPTVPPLPDWRRVAKMMEATEGETRRIVDDLYREELIYEQLHNCFDLTVKGRTEVEGRLYEELLPPRKRALRTLDKISIGLLIAITGIITSAITAVLTALAMRWLNL